MKIILITLLAAILTVSTQAQSVVITPQEKTYTRPKPIADFKKSFTVTYPKIKAATPALSRKIESAISYERNLGLNVKEEMAEVQWLEEAGFTDVYNSRGLLCVELFMSGSGAYPSGSTKTVVVNLKTGNRVKASDAFSNRGELAARVKAMLKAEIEARIKELKDDPEFREDDPASLFQDKDFTTADLEEFSVDDKGVTFIYEYSFPHVIKAVEPDGRFHFSWRQISAFIRRDGPFAQFVVR